MDIAILNDILVALFLQLTVNYLIAFFLNPRYGPLYKKLSYLFVVLAIIARTLFDLLRIFYQISLADNVSIGFIGADYAIMKPIILIAFQFIFNTFILPQILSRNAR